MISLLNGGGAFLALLSASLFFSTFQANANELRSQTSTQTNQTSAKKTEAIKTEAGTPPKSSSGAAQTNKNEGAQTQQSRKFTATAYSLRGRTASGRRTDRGVIAADHHVLPLGTRVKLDAGKYSGEYIVGDTGGAIRGERIDIWVPNTGEAMRFGRRPVKLTVLEYGARKSASKAGASRRSSKRRH